MRRKRGPYRQRRSKFDPYIDEIREMIQSGYSYTQIAGVMSDRFDYYIEPATIGYYVRHRGMRSIVTRGKNDGRVTIPRCDGCAYRIEISNTLRNGTVQVCTKMNAMISRTCTTSPMDCPFREKGTKNEIKED